MAVSAHPDRVALLEREETLAVLRAAFDEAAGRRGRLVLVAGEAGGGKTAVVEAFCAALGDRARVRSGSCDALFAPRPLAPFLEIAAAAHDPLASALARAAGPHEVAAALLRGADPRTPTVVVVEDLHWADGATLDVVRVFARTVVRAPALVVATYRDDELDAGHPLRIVLGELVARSGVDRVAVAPLSPGAVARLAAPAGIDGAALHRQTSGNPFFVGEVLAAGGADVPPSVRAAVLGRTARLGPAARAVLDAVAISPRPTELWLLDVLAGDGADALDACLAGGMLAAEPGAVAFRHELARIAVEDALPPHRRLALHRRALAALSAPPTGEPDVVRLAHHAEAAGDADAVLRFAPAAGARAAEVGAHREAAAQLGRAVRFADGLGLAERGALLRRYAESCHLTDRSADAIAATRELLAAYVAAGDRRREGESLSLLGQLSMCRLSARDAEPAARRAVALLSEDEPDAELAMAYASLAAICMNGEDLAGTRAAAARAIELAERLGETAILVHALNSLGTMELLSAGPDARHAIERSLELALDARLEPQVLRACSNMTWAAWRHRDLVLAERFLQAGLARCREPDHDLWRLQLSGYRACIRLEQWRVADALESAATAMGDPRSSPLPRVLGHAVAGLVAARRGTGDAAALLAAARALAGPGAELQRVAPAAAAAAEAAWLAGDAAAVDEVTGPALAAAVERGALPLAGQLACWRRRAGLPVDGLPDVPAPWRLELAGHAAAAAEEWAARGCVVESALALAHADDADALRRAHDALRELDVPAAAAVVARRLRARGVRGVSRGPRPSTRANDAQLTARELDVLRLVADGLRNGEVAARLHLSTRTVDSHVSAVLRKLRVRGRAEAASSARRLGLLEDR